MNARLKRVLAWIGIIVLVAMYGSTLVFALIDSPMKESLVMASVAATLVVPVLIYVCMMAVKLVKPQDELFSNHTEPTEEQIESQPEADTDEESTSDCVDKGEDKY